MVYIIRSPEPTTCNGALAKIYTFHAHMSVAQLYGTSQKQTGQGNGGANSARLTPEFSKKDEKVLG